MRVLFLGPTSSSTVAAHLRALGEDVIARDDRIAADCNADFLVSFGYRYILAQDVLDRFPGRAINLHLSLLPWNRGMHPDVWAHVDGTPSGVTLHHIDAGIDTGDIITQREVAIAADDTLRGGYDRLMAASESLFIEHWPLLRTGAAPRTPQSGPGSYHRASDLERLQPLLIAGWDTPVAALRSH